MIVSNFVAFLENLNFKTQARSTRSNSFNVSTTIPGRANRACNTKWGIWNANFLPSIRHILWLNERQKSDHFYYEENNSYLKTMKGKRGGNHLNLSFFLQVYKKSNGTSERPFLSTCSMKNIALIIKKKKIHCAQISFHFGNVRNFCNHSKLCLFDKIGLNSKFLRIETRQRKYFDVFSEPWFRHLLVT